ncbi:uncharacterized protein LOC131843035 [Achroia grisella]|uniref:uncharacterized protein LOC131843035 n=1 Tax=Achroia grisella TaxID=688607 RepID=UPI0027D32206|nr:uncharacterized protein LOC131843035 [Achroia grisella]
MVLRAGSRSTARGLQSGEPTISEQMSLQSGVLTKTAKTTPGLHERVKILKQKLTDKIKQKQRTQLISPINEEVTFDENYEYVDIESIPITPIMDNNDRKRNGKFKLPEIKTTTAMPVKIPSNSDLISESVKPLRTRTKKYKAQTAIDIFYRRKVPSNIRDVPIQWMQCQDLVTPYLVGHKKELGSPKSVKIDDPTVMRLIQLISVNTTGHTKEDIFSILFQISNLQLRFFQWDITAIKTLLNTIINEKRHSFRSLKYGLKALFKSWHLDLRNSSNILKQSRIFRPPCVTMNGHEGSTRTSKYIRYTKPKPQ